MGYDEYSRRHTSAQKSKYVSYSLYMKMNAARSNKLGSETGISLGRQVQGKDSMNRTTQASCTVNFHLSHVKFVGTSVKARDESR